MPVRVTETDAERKLRIAEEEIVRLRAERDSSPHRENEVPISIRLAAGFIDSIQRRMLPLIAAGPDFFETVTPPDLSPSEEIVFNSACELVADYFNQHNTHYRRAIENANLLFRARHSPRKKGR